MTGSRRKKFLAPEKLDEAVLEVANIAKEEGVRIVLIGGYAMHLYGSDRLTADIDFAADAALSGLPSGRRLSFGGVQTRAPCGVPVDVVLRDDDFTSLYEEAIDQAKRVRGVPVPVATAEHMVAMKMVAGRSGKDDADLEFLVLSDAANPAKARRIIQEHLGPYAAREFDLLVEEARWRHG